MKLTSYLILGPLVITALCQIQGISVVHANELVLSREEALRQGYLPFSESRHVNSHLKSLPLPKNLSWPIQFQDERHTLGNNMVNYQYYSGDLSYFHGGDDLRGDAGQWVIAPISGKIEAGFYAYTTNDDGSLNKLMKPWGEPGESLYFEVSITTAEGYRFEFHHIDRDSLTSNIVDQIVKGGQVAAGTHLGQIDRWPEQSLDGSYYHHTHYNIVDPDGVHLNPEAFSVGLPDTTAPEIHGVYSLNAAGEAVEFSEGAILSPDAQEIIVAATDHRSSDIYTQAPCFVELKFTTGESFAWDFRTALTTPSGKFPNIHDVFKDEICTSAGCIDTQGDYDKAFFLYQIPIPPGAKGKFEIHVGDASGNIATLTGSL